MDCGENSKQNLVFDPVLLYFIPECSNPCFFGTQKMWGRRKDNNPVHLPCVPRPYSFSEMCVCVCVCVGGGWGGGWGWHTVYFTTVNILTLHINITSKSPFHFSNNIIISQRNGSQPTSLTILQGRKQHIKFHNTTPKFPPISTYVFLFQWRVHRA